MPNLECPQCGAEVSANNIHCLKCDFELPEHYHAQNESEIHFFSDVLTFPFKAIWSQTSFEAIEHYREVSERGTVKKLILLPAINNFVAIIGIYLLVGGNPYIDIGIDPFTYTVLGTCFFLILTFVRFLSFRIVLGKGNFVAQGYLDAIVATNYLLLACLAVIVLYITRSEGLSNFIVIAGGLYFVIPSLVSLGAVHHLPGMRTIAGFILSIIGTVPLYFLFLFFLNFFREARPYEIYDWRLMVICIFILVPTSLVVFYMQQEEKISNSSHGKIPIKKPILVMWQQKKVKYIFIAAFVLIIGCFLLDNRYQSITEGRPALLTSFARIDNEGIRNVARDEMYYRSGSGGIRVQQYSGVDIKDSPKIEPNIRFYSVAVHPNNGMIYLIADNKIKVVNAQTLKTVDTIWLGGKLREAGFSRDGELLYVSDALWNRIRVIPIDAQD